MQERYILYFGTSLFPFETLIFYGKYIQCPLLPLFYKLIYAVPPFHNIVFFFRMASSLSRNLQLCPHCNQFLSRRTVLRHRQLYGKPHRPGWRPVLNIPSIRKFYFRKSCRSFPSFKVKVKPIFFPESHRSSRDSLIESENVTEAIREIPEEVNIYLLM